MSVKQSALTQQLQMLSKEQSQVILLVHLDPVTPFKYNASFQQLIVFTKSNMHSKQGRNNILSPT